ncbi:MAG: hypothetical protein ACRDYF_04015 [Acidimicrobiia bacterium]
MAAIAGFEDPSSPLCRAVTDFVNAFGLLGDEHVGVEQLADQLGEELLGVGGRHGTLLSGDQGRPPGLRVAAPVGC